MGADLLPGDPGRPQSLNPYSYTENNPPNAVDPFGLSSWDVTTTNGNCIVVSTYNNVEVKDKTGNWTNHTVLIGTQTTKGDRLVLVILVTAAIVVDRKLGLSYVLLVVFPVALAYGLIAGYFRRGKMRTEAKGS
jgi:hypothetical protein